MSAFVPAFTRSIECVDGIYRALSADRRLALGPFLDQYRAVRDRDGYRSDDPAYYRALPDVPLAHPERRVWQIRQQSFASVLERVRSGRFGDRPAVLDLGAGCGWLSYQLARRGDRAVAVDILPDDADGLGAARHYDVPFTRVEADFDRLPFAPGQFDVVIFNASLHYAADTMATLAGAAGMLTPGGAILVVDSPVFAREHAGQAMRVRHHRRLAVACPDAAPIDPGEGFLTFGRLAASADAAGLRPAFVRSPGGLRHRVGRIQARLTRGTAPPEFGVWVAS